MLRLLVLLATFACHAPLHADSGWATPGCTSLGGGTICTVPGPPPSNPNANSYQKLTGQQIWKRDSCLVRVTPKIAEAQKTCVLATSEAECWKLSSDCKWQSGKSQCWSPIYAKCASALYGKCTQVTFIDTTSGPFNPGRTYSCEQDVDRALVKPIDSKRP